MRLTRSIPLATIVVLVSLPGASATEWTHHAGDSARSAIAPRAPRSLNALRWSVTPDPNEEYVWRSSPVVSAGRVFINARRYADDVHATNVVIAYDVFDGARLWATPIEADAWDSWASPAVDARNQTVLLGSGYTLYALRIATGAIAWQTPLQDRIVNASPAVSADLSVDGAPANRAFITDFSGAGGDAQLYAINVDPHDGFHNPYLPGELVWTAAIPGAGGNTAAYDDGAVYVAAAGGTVAAFDGLTGAPLWETDYDFSAYPQFSGFFGGVTIRSGFVYAAGYAFSGSGNNCPLIKVDATTGDVVWDVPCERTDSIPVVTDDGRIYLSAGLDGFGSTIKIQAFQDHGDWASLLWDTYVDTAGGLSVGGWLHQPASARGYLYSGHADTAEFFGPYTDLYVLDTSKVPGDPSFIAAHHLGAGGSPAVADGTLYSFGQGGLIAFEPSPACLADLDGDGAVGLSDLATLLAAYGSSRGDVNFDSGADLNRDGTVDLADLAALLAVYGATCL